MKRFAVPTLFGVVLSVLCVAGAPQLPSTAMVLRLVNDPDFYALPIQRNGEPMPLARLQTTSASNIVRVNFTDSQQLCIRVQGPFRQQDQMGINLDTDQNGVGDYWILLPDLIGDPVGLLTDGAFVPLGVVPYFREEVPGGLCLLLNEIAAQSALSPDDIFDPGLLIVTFDRGISQLEVMPFDTVSPEFKPFASFQLGEPIEMVQLNVPVLHTPAFGVLLTGAQTERQQLSLHGNHCPLRRRSPIADVDGDGFPDGYIYENTQVYGEGPMFLRIEWWCLSDAAFGIRITQGSGQTGWIGQSPYEGSRNALHSMDENGDGIPDVIRMTIMDGSRDDDRDGHLDILVYQYHINSSVHTSTHYEIEQFYQQGLSAPQQRHLVEHMGPYTQVSDLPTF